MRVIALDSATKGRPRPSFFLLLTLAGSAALAQQPVFRCGQEYTNAPVDPTGCERLAGQAVTVIPGTRVQVGTTPAVSEASPSSPSVAKVESASQKQRDDMARAIVSVELDKARQRHAELQLQYRKAQQPTDSAAQSQLKAAIDRTQRDIDSLQRELDRRPAGTAQP
jgi:hypothetical protein